ncbi:MAG TPA: cytochrome C oxidase subunit IV family protein [Sulfurovum sp.]|nr:MAG: hypothetical protein B7Y23_10140 [Sulfurovum sp. 16-42-52]OZA43459.1 MAG: hypothetical protein B7X80_09295 [Sulfurovum sp. 17-42-90]HQS72239.1 cytochrome C oxidase subunit IV family protein [Sulfurovum sp.]
MQKNVIKNTAEIVWFTLVLLSIFAFSLGYVNCINPIVVSILLISTFIKGQVVIDYFMGLKYVQLRYRFIPTAWLFTIILLISVAYYLPT